MAHLQLLTTLCQEPYDKSLLEGAAQAPRRYIEQMTNDTQRELVTR